MGLPACHAEPHSAKDSERDMGHRGLTSREAWKPYSEKYESRQRTPARRLETCASYVMGGSSFRKEGVRLAPGRSPGPHEHPCLFDLQPYHEPRSSTDRTSRWGRFPAAAATGSASPP